MAALVRRALEPLATLGEFSLFAARVLAAVPAALWRPGLVMVQMARIIEGCLLIIVLIGLALGLVTWMHVGQVLGRFESESLLPSLLMVAVVMEFGPVSVGLFAAGRVASGMAAELAAMNTTEQVDALRLLGVSPFRWLVAPRVLACTLVLAPFALIVDQAALLGSFAAERVAGTLTWHSYLQHALEHLRLIEAVLATGKAVVFGLLVGLVACWHGLHAERSTEAVGSAATRAVLWSTLAVLFSNVLLVRAIQLIAD